ncbi:DUF3870 domain-containing protein [Saccharomonospora sp. NPDC046836]|uniref:DUF3870 domain-containing protein n=1 Tax=Saccharomonospora sp. NPDC046836 TaxID=3156921 RepID=UPI00340977B9
MNASRSVIVVGYAKAPKVSAVRAINEYVSVTLRLDSDTGEITEVDSSAVSHLVRNWLSELLVGVDFTGDISAVLAQIESNYLSNAAASVKQAVWDAWCRYAAYRAK